MIQVLDFYAEWCVPCKAVSNVIDQLHDEYGDRVQFRRFDVEEETELVSIHNIRNVPTIIILKEGDIVAKHSGSITKQMFKQLIDTWV